MTKNAFTNHKKYNTIVPPEMTVPQRILAEVVYGLSSRDCKGMGICKINAVKKAVSLLTTGTCNSSFAYLFVINPTTIQLDFLRDSVSSIQFAERFAEGFCLEEAFVLPPFITESLAGCKPVLMQGLYPVKLSTAFISVEFMQAEL